MSDEAPIQITDLPEDEIPAEEGGAWAQAAWDGEETELSDAVLQRGHRYGSAVNMSRAIPDLRDGMKPVHRRIVWGLVDVGARPDKPHKKSAMVVGQILGHYHPHGDQSVYDAMVRMGQPWVSPTPLIDPQGNFGSPDGDPAAAMRYTEARLSPLAAGMLADLRPEVVPFGPNFSETTTEPLVLPVAWPALLTMGIEGVGWAMACSIPPHNLAEVAKAAVLVAENPEASLARVMKALPGPDFPDGGRIVNPEALPDIYTTGRGTVSLEGRWHIETIPGGRQVVVTELPYGVGPSAFIKEVVEAARAGKTEQITEFPRDLSGEHGIRIECKVKRGGDAERLVADLLRHTRLRTTISINLTILSEGRPQTLGIVEILRRWAAWREGVIRKRLEYERRTLEGRLRRLLALLAALDAIDKVIKIVRASETEDEAKAKLIAALKWMPHGARKAVPIDEEQAEWILETPIRRLVRLRRLEIEQEAQAVGVRIDEIDATLAAETGCRDILVDELRSIGREYGQLRRTQLGGEALFSDGGAASPLAAAGGEECLVYLATSGMALATEVPRRMPAASPLRLPDDAELAEVVRVPAAEQLVVLTTHGRALVIPPPAPGRKGQGQSLVRLAADERVATALATGGSEEFACLVSARGQIKRVAMDLLTQAHAGGQQVMRLDHDDMLIGVVPHGTGAELLMATALGRILRTAMDPVRIVQSASAGGVAGMGLRGDDVVAAANCAEGEALWVLHEAGHAKRVPLAEIPTKGRGGGGVELAKTTAPAKDPAGPVAAIATANDITVHTARGQLRALTSTDAPPVARAVVSKRLVEVGLGDRVVCVA